MPVSQAFIVSNLDSYHNLPLTMFLELTSAHRKIHCLIYNPPCPQNEFAVSQPGRSLVGHSPWGCIGLDMTEATACNTHTRGYRQLFSMVLPAESLQPWLTFWDPTPCGLPGSSVHGAFWQVEWIAVSFSRGSFQPKGQIQVSMSTGLEGEFFTTGTTYH